MVLVELAGKMGGLLVTEFIRQLFDRTAFGNQFHRPLLAQFIEPFRRTFAEFLFEKTRQLPPRKPKLLRKSLRAVVGSLRQSRPVLNPF